MVAFYAGLVCLGLMVLFFIAHTWWAGAILGAVGLALVALAGVRFRTRGVDT